MRSETWVLETTFSRGGDAAARREFRALFAPQAVRMVRQTLRPGAVATPFARRIADEARRVAGVAHAVYAAGPEGDALIHQVACALTDWIVAGLEAPASNAARETVCNL